MKIIEIISKKIKSSGVRIFFVKIISPEVVLLSVIFLTLQFVIAGFSF